MISRVSRAAVAEVEGRCAHCGRELAGGLWFARIQRGGRTVEFCRPRCLEAFLNAANQANPALEDRYGRSDLITTEA